MRLDPTLLRYLEDEHFRVLTAVEMGMKNHELVPTPLVERIAQLRCGGTKKRLQQCLKYKLVVHENKLYDGFRLTYLGYDFLALRALLKRGVVTGVGNKVGVGKEADIYCVTDESGREMILKLHRLGRTSFQKITQKRDYFRRKGKRGGASWLYLSRLSAMKEYAFMRALHEENFPVPEPIDQNRHCILMSRLPGHPLTQIRHMANPTDVYKGCLNIIARLAQYGLIHCDFNEFNIMVGLDETVYFLDFPQMTSTEHLNGQMYLDRDIDCIHTFFERKFNIRLNYKPQLKVDEDVVKRYDLDGKVHASGWNTSLQNELERWVTEQSKATPEEAEGSDSDEGGEDVVSDEDLKLPEDEKWETAKSAKTPDTAAAASAAKDEAEGTEAAPPPQSSAHEQEEAKKPTSRPKSAVKGAKATNAENEESNQKEDQEEENSEEGEGEEEESEEEEGASVAGTQTSTALRLNKMTTNHIKSRVKSKLQGQSNREFNRKLAKGSNLQKGREKKKQQNQIKGVMHFN